MESRLPSSQSWHYIAFYIIVFLHSSFAGESDYHFQVKPRQDENFLTAQFSIVLPPSEPAGILVLLPGWEGDGSHLLSDEALTGLSRKFSLIRIACTFKNVPGKRYDDASGGSGRALQAALHTASEHSLDPLPVMLFGHSAGGQFAFSFAGHYPKHVLGFAASRGGIYSDAPPEAVYAIPGLFCAGGRDAEYRRDGILTLFLEGRDKDAPWAMSIEPEGDHSLGRSTELAAEFFADLILARKADPSSRPKGMLVATPKLPAEPGLLREGDASWLPGVRSRKLWETIHGSGAD
jgi:pimeloyl-ACP methyl ester carboxylesterase